MTPYSLLRPGFLALTLTGGTAQAVTCVPLKPMALGHPPADTPGEFDFTLVGRSSE